MNYTKTLETDRLILRKFTMEDADSMFNNWASDENTVKYVAWPLHKNIEDTKAVISSWIDKYENGSYNWIVELKDTHEVIGNVADIGFNLKHSTIELGYCYGSKYWNKGYATETLKAAIKYLLEEENFYMVTASHRSSNPASGKVMQKAGMKYDGTLRERKLNPDGTRSDMIYYSIKKDELK